jgi:class 3 adenylate cyclase
MLVLGVLNCLLFGGARLLIQGLGLCAIGLLIASFFFDIGMHLDTEPIPTAISIVGLFAYVGLIGATAYRLRLRQRDTKLALEREEQKSQQLLLNVFPQAVIPRLKAGESPIADEFADVTVLFTDIVGYTPLAERLGPRQTVLLLNDLFRRFDQAAAKFGVEKIETVGDGYLAVGGAPQRRDNHPEAVAALALAMVEASRHVPVSATEHVEIRIGIHTGPIFGGVVGEHRFHYAIFGETVNVASRIQNQSQSGRILVSESTYKRIRGTCRLEECASLDLKGHGPMRTYWLLGLPDECRPNSGFQRDAPRAARA